MSAWIEPEGRWEPWSADVVHIAGPERIRDDGRDDDRPTPVGFTARIGRLLYIEDEIKPLPWEGDNA